MMKGQNIMDWRTDKITAEELEKKMKEYAERMMKMAQNTAPKAPSSERSSVSLAGIEEAITVAVTEEASEVINEDSEEAVAEISEEAVEVSVEMTEVAESAEGEVFDDIDEAPDTTTEDDELSGTNFGVFTAEEILSGDYTVEGFEKANEIIEEITKKKEIMKELAENNTPEADCDCTGEIPEIADVKDIFGEDVICPKCGKRKMSGRRG